MRIFLLPSSIGFSHQLLAERLLSCNSVKQLGLISSRVSLFCAFGIFICISCSQNVGEIDTWCQFHRCQFHQHSTYSLVLFYLHYQKSKTSVLTVLKNKYINLDETIFITQVQNPLTIICFLSKLYRYLDISGSVAN